MHTLYYWQIFHACQNFKQINSKKSSKYSNIWFALTKYEDHYIKSSYLNTHRENSMLRQKTDYNSQDAAFMIKCRKHKQAKHKKNAC